MNKIHSLNKIFFFFLTRVLCLKTSRPPVASPSDMAHHHFDSRSHSTVLSASLENLQLSRETVPPDQEEGANDVMNEFLPNLIENIDSHKTAAESSKAPPFHSGSGVSSPYTSISATGIESPIPDPNGLGWPGVCVCEIPGKTVFSCCCCCCRSVSHSSVFQQRPHSSD